MADVDVLVVGAGPVGLTAAAELRRHGVECRIVDALPAPQHYAKAVGIQPRTMEVWDSMGLIREALDEAGPLFGQLAFVDGKPGPRMELRLPPEIPYAFAALPQYTTERLLTEHLARFGTTVERETALHAVEQHPDRVEATARSRTGAGGPRTRWRSPAARRHRRLRAPLTDARPGVRRRSGTAPGGRPAVLRWRRS